MILNNNYSYYKFAHSKRQLNIDSKNIQEIYKIKNRN